MAKYNESRFIRAPNDELDTDQRQKKKHPKKTKQKQKQTNKQTNKHCTAKQHDQRVRGKASLCPITHSTEKEQNYFKINTSHLRHMPP